MNVTSPERFQVSPELMLPIAEITHGAEPEQIREQCGVVGVMMMEATGNLAQVTHAATNAVQKRGYDAGGEEYSDGGCFDGVRGFGRIKSVIPDGGLESDAANPNMRIGVGHVRYGTATDVDPRVDYKSIQPVKKPDGSQVLVHNGHFENSTEVALEFGVIPEPDVSESVTVGRTLFALAEALGSMREAAMVLLPKLKGAFTLVFSDGENLYAARDTRGYKPGSIGVMGDGNGFMVSSESVSFDQASPLIEGGIAFLRDIRPGELVTISRENGLETDQFAPPQRPRACGLDAAYVMRAASLVGNGIATAGELREFGYGMQLAKEHPVDNPEEYVVVPVPESGRPAAIGYANELGIDVLEFVEKVEDLRSFLGPDQVFRQEVVKKKLHINTELLHLVAGRKLIIVDDSYLRGNTALVLNGLIIEAFAEAGLEPPEIHWRSPYPKVTNECGLGVDFGKTAELAGRVNNPDGSFRERRSDEDIAKRAGSTSMRFISGEGFAKASLPYIGEICRKCFTDPEDEPVTGSDKQSDLVLAVA